MQRRSDRMPRKALPTDWRIGLDSPPNTNSRAFEAPPGRIRSRPDPWPSPNPAKLCSNDRLSRRVLIASPAGSDFDGAFNRAHPKGNRFLSYAVRRGQPTSTYLPATPRNRPAGAQDSRSGFSSSYEECLETHGLAKQGLTITAIVRRAANDPVSRTVKKVLLINMGAGLSPDCRRLGIAVFAKARRQNCTASRTRSVSASSKSAGDRGRVSAAGFGPGLQNQASIDCAPASRTGRLEDAAGH